MKKLVGLLATAVCVAGCSSSDDSKPAGGDSYKPSAILGTIAEKAESAGTAIGNAVVKNSASASGVFSKLLKASGPSIMDVSERCHSRNGTPIAVTLDTYKPITDAAACNALNSLAYWDDEDKKCNMTERHPEYPGNLAYCLLAMNTGNSASILGAFSQLKGMMCAFEKAGVTWNSSDPGSDQTVTLTLDTACFEAEELADMCDGQPSCQVPVEVRAYLKPDSHYDARVKMTIDRGDQKMSYDAKIKKTDSISEIAVNMAGTNDPKQFDAYAAKYDASANSFTYEGRFDRFNSSQGGTGGWSRHIRVFADLDDSAAQVLPEHVEVAYSNVYDNTGGNYASSITTLKGSMTGANPGMIGESYGFSSNDLADVINGTELAANIKVASCYLPNAPADLDDCEHVDAIAIPKDDNSEPVPLGFFLAGSTYRKESNPDYSSGEYLSNAAWFESLLGISFTSVDLTKPEP